MNERKDLNRSSKIYRFAVWGLGTIKLLDLITNFRRFGFDEGTIRNLIIVIGLFVLCIMDIIYDKKRRDIPKVILIIIFVLFIITYIASYIY